MAYNDIITTSNISIDVIENLITNQFSHNKEKSKYQIYEQFS